MFDGKCCSTYIPNIPVLPFPYFPASCNSSLSLLSSNQFFFPFAFTPILLFIHTLFPLSYLHWTISKGKYTVLGVMLFHYLLWTTQLFHSPIIITQEQGAHRNRSHNSFMMESCQTFIDTSFIEQQVPW